MLLIQSACVAPDPGHGPSEDGELRWVILLGSALVRAWFGSDDPTHGGFGHPLILLGAWMMMVGRRVNRWHVGVSRVEFWSEGVILLRRCRWVSRWLLLLLLLMVVVVVVVVEQEGPQDWYAPG